MTVIRHMAGPNPLVGFRLDAADIFHVGRDLQRPECVLAERNGTLWTADARGGVMRIMPEGTQELIVQRADSHFDLSADAAASLLSGTLPNGLAFDANGDILVSNFGTDRLERMTRSGETKVMLDAIDGVPLGKVNFVLRDRRGRVWITISTQVNPWSEATKSTLADGSIILVDERGARVVADGFHFTNEIRLDATEEWLYVSETTAKRITRLRVTDDGSLIDREVFGPASLGAGLVDGIAFDEYGNLWATMIMAERLVAITPKGDLLELFDNGDPMATAAFEDSFATGEAVPFDIMLECRGTVTNWLASVTFGGSDLRTVHMGSLRGTTLPSFRSPVAGLPMVHW